MGRRADSGRREARSPFRWHRADTVLIVCCLAFSAALMGFLALRGRSIAGQGGADLVLFHEKDEIGRFALEQERERYLLITYTAQGAYVQAADNRPSVPDDRPYNLLRLADGQVSMEAADCPDLICVHHLPISSHGESIICLPHKLTAAIEGGSKSEGLEELDGVVR